MFHNTSVLTHCRVENWKQGVALGLGGAAGELNSSSHTNKSSSSSTVKFLLKRNLVPKSGSFTQPCIWPSRSSCVVQNCCNPGEVGDDRSGEVGASPGVGDRDGLADGAVVEAAQLARRLPPEGSERLRVRRVRSRHGAQQDTARARGSVIQCCC